MHVRARKRNLYRQRAAGGVQARLEARIASLEEQVEQLASQMFRAARVDGFAETPQATGIQGEDRHVAATGDGWLLVMIEGARTALPSGLKVRMTGSAGGRDRGTVLEGPFQGKDFDTVSGNLHSTYRRVQALQIRVARRAGGPRTIDGSAYDLDVHLSFTEEGAQKSAGPYAAKTHPDNPTPPGEHVIELPDFPHALGASYGAHGTVWFRIGSSGDRYVHPGRVSAGCITCAPSHWEAMYAVLHCARAGSDPGVARLRME